VSRHLFFADPEALLRNWKYIIDPMAWPVVARQEAGIGE
jgi:hypothetical protein